MRSSWLDSEHQGNELVSSYFLYPSGQVLNAILLTGRVLLVLVNQQDHDDLIMVVGRTDMHFQTPAGACRALISLTSITTNSPPPSPHRDTCSSRLLSTWFLSYLPGSLIMVAFVHVARSACFLQQWAFVGHFPCARHCGRYWRYSKE